MAMFDVHPREANTLCLYRRSDEIINQSTQIVVTQQTAVRSDTEPRIQERMSISNCRLEWFSGKRPCESSGMCQLEPDKQISGATKRSRMRILKQLSQRGKLRQILFAHYQLIRICTAIETHSDRFTTPHQLGTAEPEPGPAAAGEFRRTAVLRAIPALHGKYAPAIADPTTDAGERLCERTSGPGLQHFIEGQLYAKHLESAGKLFRRSQCGNSGP
jgi:hypothetical protein